MSTGPTLLIVFQSRDSLLGLPRELGRSMLPTVGVVDNDVDKRWHVWSLVCDSRPDFGTCMSGSGPICVTERGRVMTSTDSQPDLLYILSDQHTSTVMGCAGDAIARTPNLDRLAARGTRLTNLYCPSPICTPSRMSMLTGKHPFQNHAWTNEHVLSGAFPTWPHALGAAGYRPSLIGRLHSRGADQLLGYAERAVGDHSPNHVGSPPPERGVLDGTHDPLRVSLARTGTGQSPYELHDVDVTEHAVARLDQIAGRRRSGDDSPFALSVGLMLPHQPYVAQARDYQIFDGRVPQPGHPGLSEHPYHRWWRSITQMQDVTETESQRARIAYYALVYRLDYMIGQILDALDRNGLADNTLVVYLSDHGDHLGEHGLWWKQTFYEEAVKSPGILAWPGHIPEGALCASVAGSIDVTATVLDALGAPPLPNSPGLSMLPLIRGDAEAARRWPDEAFSEYVTDLGCTHRMVRSGPWKLNYYHRQPPQLFNIDDDPTEQVDLSAEPAYAAILARLTARVLDGWDPTRIEEEISAISADTDILRAWAQNIQPTESYRWPMSAAMSRLDTDLGS